MSADSFPGDPGGISAWLRIDDRLTTSGQPTEAQLTALKDLGVEHVVNLALHTHEKALADETASVRSLDMGYVHLPVDFNAPTEDDLHAFYEAMDRIAGRMVHVHCIANMRVSAFLYRRHRDRLGMPEDKARALMDRVWRPGGVWATFIGDPGSEGLPHRVAGRDYEPVPDAEGRTA